MCDHNSLECALVRNHLGSRFGQRRIAPVGWSSAILMLVKLRSCIPTSCAVLFLVLLLVVCAAAACACVCCIRPVPVALFWVAGMRRELLAQTCVHSPCQGGPLGAGGAASAWVPAWVVRWGRCLCLGACLWSAGAWGVVPLLGCLGFYFLSSAICGDLYYRHPTHMCPDGPCV